MLCFFNALETEETSNYYAFNKIPFTYDYDFKTKSIVDKETFLLSLNHLLPNFIWNMTASKGLDFTIRDIVTYVIKGITVGGYKINDETIIRNIFNSWKYIISESQLKDTLNLNNLIKNINVQVLLGLNNNLGEFRKSGIKLINSPNWTSLNPTYLPKAFVDELNFIKQLDNPYEKALITFLWLHYYRFFEDGNDFTAHLVCNYLLLKNNLGVLTVPRHLYAKFNELLDEFYCTADATKIISFLDTNCMFTLDKDKFTCKLSYEFN